MNFNRLSSRISQHYILDPYSTLMHYKKTFKFLKALRQIGDVSVLCLGNKHQIGINWQNYFKGHNVPVGKCDKRVLTSASQNYDVIICSDMVFHSIYLKGLSLPVIGIASSNEIISHPEILEVIDYLIPVPTNQNESAMKYLIQRDYLGEENSNFGK